MACDKNIRWGGLYREEAGCWRETDRTILLVHTKKIMSKTSSSSLSISYIGVGQILMGCSKKKNVLFSGGFGCLLWVLGSGVWGQIASVPACWIGNDSGGSWCELRMPVHLSLGCFLPHYHELWHGTRALACFPFDDSQIWVNTL